MSNERFDLSFDNIPRLDIKLKYVSLSKYENDWNSTLHTHQFAEFFYIQKGKGRFVVEGKSFDVAEDDLVLINPNVEHTEYSLEKSPLQYAVIGVEGISFITSKKNPEPYLKYNYKPYKDETLFLLKSMLREINNKERFSEVVYNNLFEVMFINIVRRVNIIVSKDDSKFTKKEINIVKRYIDSNFKCDITLDELAVVAHMNKYYLVHSFKDTYGLSPIQYLTQKRIEESKHLLTTTNNSLSQIANIVGLSSSSYFSQTFKKYTGVSPNNFRKTN